MTASRVFADPERVKEATRLRVLEVAGRLGYRKDLYASINSKKRGRLPADRTILFNCRFEQLLEPSTFPFFSLVYFHFLRAIMKRGWRTVLTDVEADPASFVTAGAGDALVLCGDVDGAALGVAERQAAGTPILALCAGPVAPHTIDPDDARGGAMAAEYFHARGHRHVAVFFSPKNRNHVDRRTAFEDRLAALDPAARIDAVPMDLTRDRVRTDALAEASLSGYFGDLGALPDSVFVVNSYSAHLVWRYLRKRGVSVPGQIGFLGYDNPPFYQETEVPLSRIWFDPGAVGQEAAARVAVLLEKPASRPNRILLPVSLIDCASVLPKIPDPQSA